ncbi:MAG: hypothetical protein E6109_13645 [Ruminococcus sp.]|nr:hypothetical protein [Ruminococcus sp.]
MEKKLTYGVWAVRSSTSIFGPAQSWCKENGKPLEFDTKADAENYAKEANEHTTANVRYYVKEKEPEPGAVRKGTSQPELDALSHEEVTPRFGDLYPLNYREYVERMKQLTCPIGNVAVAFEDGNVITIPYQERRQLMNRLMPEHGVPKTMTYLPENEPELMMILKRERFKRNYHATAGNLEEYLDKLEKTTLREKLKRAKMVVSTQEVSSHKRGLER